jgi:hypothetical protein
MMDATTVEADGERVTTYRSPSGEVGLGRVVSGFLYVPDGGGGYVLDDECRGWVCDGGRGFDLEEFLRRRTAKG